MAKKSWDVINGHSLTPHESSNKVILNLNGTYTRPISYCEFTTLTFTFNPVKKLGQTWVVYKRLKIELVRMCVRLKKKSWKWGEIENFIPT